jgi:hypothetical protein
MRGELLRNGDICLPHAATPAVLLLMENLELQKKCETKQCKTKISPTR